MESHRVRHDLTTKQQHHNVKSMGVTYTAAAKSLQSCPTLCDPIDGSPPGSPVAGILQARTLEWVVISFSNAWKWSCSVVSNSSRPHGLQPTRLLRPWNFPGKKYWSGVPLPSPNVPLVHQLKSHCLFQRGKNLTSFFRKLLAHQLKSHCLFQKGGIFNIFL